MAVLETALLDPAADHELPPVMMSRRKRVVKRLARNPLAVMAIVYLIAVVIVAVFANVIAPYGFADRDPGLLLGSPSRHHLLGTDALGRDTFTRLVFAARVSLRISVSVVAAASVIAIPLGLFSGYKGGRIDYLIMRLAEAGNSFPPLVLAMAVAGILGPGTTNAMYALTVVVVPGLTRVTRGQALAVREETFVEASKAIGTRDWRVMAKRVLPSVASPLIVQGTVMLGGVLLAEAGLSYLGLGTRLPTPSWGNMLREGYDTALFTNPWQVVIPGIAIALTVLAFNTLGDGLRDALGVARSGPKGRSQRRGLTTVFREKAPAEVPAPDTSTLLAVKGLTVEFATERGQVRVLENLSFSINHGEVLGLVGESGSGKSVTALSIMRLLPSPPGLITEGQVLLEGTDLLALPLKSMREVRGRRISMIFQDPMTSLDPAFTVGHHLIEAQRNHADISKSDARKRSVELLDLVQIPAAAERIDSYPHQLSGGMRQRVMIATALASNPSLLIADEPTTALDVTVQAQILDLLRELQRELKMAMLFVTHDLGVIADISDRVAVMYAGQIVEESDAADVFRRPQHPYTEGLLGAMPRLHGDADRLTIIRGMVPMAHAFPNGCRFHPRCEYATDACRGGAVELDTRSGGGRVRCPLSSSLSLIGTAGDALASERVKEKR
ncbi:MAG: peptide/nickel transport system ATP-binding protein [Actinomycetota bacterium]|jgi:peptide/nickel transport system permease protein|nr:peptide/nickel transport system ATP-binding protein [Actinomycetota bacterium]